MVFGSRLPQPARGPLGAREPDPSVVADIVRGFHERFPRFATSSPQRAWGGWIAMTPSWLPVAGEAAANVFYAVGYNGHGLARAPYLGTLLADRLAGDDLHDDLRAVWRTRPRFAPAPLFSEAALRAGWAIDRISDRLARRSETRPKIRGHDSALECRDPLRRGGTMNLQRIALVLVSTGFALLLGAVVLGDRPADGQEASAVLRARAIELVDDRGKVRAQLNVEGDGAVLRLRDLAGRFARSSARAWTAPACSSPTSGQRLAHRSWRPAAEHH